MHESNHILTVLVLLAAAVVVVGLFRRLKLSPVLGYLVAGTLVGPSGLGLIQDVEGAMPIAELGVVLLLFVIGLEFSLGRLAEMRMQVFGFGGLQVLVTGGVLTAIAVLAGLDTTPATVIGFGLALSSTALVLQVLDENHGRQSQVGRLSFAVLLMQDLAVVPLLVVVPLIATADTAIGTVMLDALLHAVLALVVVFFAGRLLMRPVFRAVASLHHAEIFSAFTLLVVLGVAYLFHSVNLSMALGAFIAGLLLSETEFKHQVEADIMPYKGLFLGLFFMVVGMTVNLELVRTELVIILTVLAGLMAIKAAIIILLCRVFGFNLSAAIHAGLTLSQGGEFAFILFGIASTYGLLSEITSQLLLVVVTLSMALTPFLYQLGGHVVRSARSPASRAPILMERRPETEDMNNHVVIIGLGKTGQTVAKLLSAVKVQYVALDSDPYMVMHGRRSGFNVYYGDGTKRSVLEATGLARARMVVVTVGQVYTASKAVIAVKNIRQTLPVLARSQDLKSLMKLEESGVDAAVAEIFEASLQLGGMVLRRLGVADGEIGSLSEMFRQQDYALTRLDTVSREVKTRPPGTDRFIFRRASVTIADPAEVKR